MTSEEATAILETCRTNLRRLADECEAAGYLGTSIGESIQALRTENTLSVIIDELTKLDMRIRSVTEHTHHLDAAGVQDVIENHKPKGRKK